MSTRILILAAALLSLTLPPVSAQSRTEQRTTLAREVVDLIWPQIGQSMEATMRNLAARTPIDQRPAFARALTAVTGDRFKARIVEVWARHFTEEELRHISAFYASPAGRSLLSKTGDVQRDTGTAAQELIGEALHEAGLDSPGGRRP